MPIVPLNLCNYRIVSKCSLPQKQNDEDDIKNRGTVITPSPFVRLCEKNSVNSKTVIKTMYGSGLKNQPLRFFTVYNEYCNLSRFFGYQPDGMERSGMESG